MNELGGLADGDRDLGGGGRGKLDLAVLDGRRQPRLGVDWNTRTKTVTTLSCFELFAVSF